LFIFSTVEDVMAGACVNLAFLYVVTGNLAVSVWK